MIIKKRYAHTSSTPLLVSSVRHGLMSFRANVSKGSTLFRTGVSKGFTLIEMLVVTSIIIVVSGVILADSGRLGGQFILNNFAYDLALTLREAQQYGISVQNYQGSFNVAYGVHFLTSSPTTYILFADTNQNGIYDTGELVQSYTITRGFRIGALCATDYANSGIEDCTLSSLDVLFKRPEPDAHISANGASCTLQPSLCKWTSRVIMQSPRGNMKSVVIPANGQMSVQ